MNVKGEVRKQECIDLLIICLCIVKEAKSLQLEMLIIKQKASNKGTLTSEQF